MSPAVTQPGWHRRRLLAALATGPMLVDRAPARGQPLSPTPGPAAPRPEVLDRPALASLRALQATLLAVSRAGDGNAPRLVAVGERGTVLLSDDGGRAWRQAAQVPVQVTLTGVRFANARQGWAVGHLGVILRTEDSGEHWIRQLDGLQAAAACAEAATRVGDERLARQLQRLGEEGPDKPFFDIACRDARTAWAVGAYGLAFVTHDGGQRWQPLTPALDNPRSLHLYGVLPPGPATGGRLLVVGEQGLVLRGDSGAAESERLSAQASGSRATLFGVVAAPSGGLLAHGLRGTLLRSDDGGQRWQAQDSGVSASLAAAAPLPDGRVAVLAQSGELLLVPAPGVPGQPLQRRPAPPGSLPAAGLSWSQGTDGTALVVAGLRGLRRQSLA
ncbi:YCF48-related protein [Ideonella livida]|uniref:Glycosyl hydrolase n=1 Tax=Ideonella livida TaxID=2707176 RepID=A0A7C9PHH0_9BURK|nr:YCF48-related protein [Ideonella livida]NDY92093.1 glycosyl hydrolase [Ideonella livida]